MFSIQFARSMKTRHPLRAWLRVVMPSGAGG
jgi:hypothetical protein